jgi:hypothetical protein
MLGRGSKMWGRVAQDEVQASPPLIALMRTTTTLPVFLVGFPAGALADIVNRRRLLLATQGLILVTAVMLSVLNFTRLMNAPLLLGFTFVLGLGAILANPAWQAVNAELVPPDELPAAVTLSSVSYNLARGVPPQRYRLPVRGRGARSLAPTTPQSGPAPITPGRRYEDGGALRAELTADADRAATHLLLYLLHHGGPE